MKKVLFIAYNFPPTRSVGGSLRSEKFVRYLPEFGWEPTVIALDEKNRQPEKYPRVYRLPSPTPWSKPYQVQPIGWALVLPTLLRNILSSQRFDALYVSSPPFHHAFTAVRCATKYGIPALVDLRDAWSLNPYVKDSFANKIGHHILYPWLEKRTLDASSLLIVNTESAMSAYIRRYPWIAHRIQVLPNGFDDEDFQVPISQKLSAGPFTLLYTGRFGIGARSPQILLDALKRARGTGTDIRLQIVGDDSPMVHHAVSQLGLENAVTVRGHVPHSEATNMLLSAHALVLYQQPSQSPVTAVAGKSHEYLRAGRPILAIAPEGDNLRLIRHYAPLSRCIASYDVEEIAHAINEFADMYASGSLGTILKPNTEYLQQFNRQVLTGKLAGLLASISSAF